MTRKSKAVCFGNLPVTDDIANAYPLTSNTQPGIGYLDEPLGAVVQLEDILSCDIPLEPPREQPGYTLLYRRLLEHMPRTFGKNFKASTTLTVGSLVGLMSQCESITSLPIPAYHGGYNIDSKARSVDEHMSAALFIPYCFARVTDGSRWWTGRPFRVDNKRGVANGHDLLVHMFPGGNITGSRSEAHYSELQRNLHRQQIEHFLGVLLMNKMEVRSTHKKLITATFALDEMRSSHSLILE